MGAHAGIQQRLGFRPERRHQQGLSRHQDGRGIPAGEVPVLPGSRSPRERQLQPNQTAFPSAKTRPRTDGRCQHRRRDRFRAARQIDNATISTTNFISSQKVAWAGYVQDDWKVIAETDGEHRPSLRTLVADRRTIRTTGELRPADDDALHPERQAAGFAVAAEFRHLVPQRQSFSRQSSNTWFPGINGTSVRVSACLSANKTVIRAGYGIFYGGERNRAAARIAVRAYRSTKPLKGMPSPPFGLPP